MRHQAVCLSVCLSVRVSVTQAGQVHKCNDNITVDEDEVSTDYESK